jgi:DNA-binding response OmpR family regulator
MTSSGEAADSGSLDGEAADGYIPKPFAPEELRSGVRTALRATCEGS